MFFSKRRSEYSRLEQEYAHKKAIAKSYLSFKKQIDNLQSIDPEMTKSLLETAIHAIGFNAAETLDKNHGEDPTIKNVIDGVSKPLRNNNS